MYQMYQEKGVPEEGHLRMRDFYYQPSFQMFGVKQKRPSFVKQSAEYMKNFVAFNQLGYLQSISFQHQMEKHQYWNRLRKMQVKDKEDHGIKSAVNSIVWTYRLLPISVFLFAGATVVRVTGIHKMSGRKQLAGLVVAAVMGDMFVRAKKSSDIFYLIPPLGNKELEEERIDIINKSLVLDGKINEIENHPQFIDELIDEAEKESDPAQRKLILEAAGYTVVDRVDYEY